MLIKEDMNDNPWSLRLIHDDNSREVIAIIAEKGDKVVMSEQESFSEIMFFREDR